ncbi:hypothetical protein EW145_g3155 [Phellinidium pouzarii]|uniref:Protein kinase domain-containing protein n=1 Tax=Phellinidium pouzarii TaxID=167371 RepID=A0A4S4L8E5_9AGAM|nr:hypothetical protein EW145_g3155 [Phellinidium pouzarii]
MAVSVRRKPSTPIVALPSPESLEHEHWPLAVDPPRRSVSQACSKAPSETRIFFEILAEHVHLDLTGKVLQDGRHPRGLGGFCDVFLGLSLTHGFTVAIKRFRVHIHHDRSFLKSLARELHIWSKLHHPNVLPLLGYTIDDGVYPALISRWMSNGTSIQYLKDNPGTNVLTMVKGIAAGLAYLHAMGVVHSDLKSDNVLVSMTGAPLLADFGVSRIIIESKTIETKSSMRGSVRWMAIELFEASLPGNCKEQNLECHSGKHMHTEQADIWAFGMTVYELMTLLRPYYLLPSDFQVMFAIIQGKLPSLPKVFLSGTATMDDSVLWDICRVCWHKDPALRPTMKDINRQLAQGISAAEIPRAGVCLVSPPYSMVDTPFPTDERSSSLKKQIMTGFSPKDQSIQQTENGDSRERFKRERVFPSPSECRLEGGLSAQAPPPRVLKPHKFVSAEQRVRLRGLVCPTMTLCEKQGVQVLRKSASMNASLTSINAFVASDPSGLLTATIVSSSTDGILNQVQSSAAPGIVIRRFCLPCSSSWTLVSSASESDMPMSFTSNPLSPSPINSTSGINARLRRVLDHVMGTMRSKSSVQ